GRTRRPVYWRPFRAVRAGKWSEDGEPQRTRAPGAQRRPRLDRGVREARSADLRECGGVPGAQGTRPADAARDRAARPAWSRGRLDEAHGAGDRKALRSADLPRDR